jgi:hypothetical protein
MNPGQRGVSEKSLRLAAFMATRPPLSKEETWTTRMEEWNAAVEEPTWRYTRPSNMQRDAQRSAGWLMRSQ